MSSRSDSLRELLRVWNERGISALETEAFEEFARSQVHPQFEARVFGNPMLPETYRGAEGWLQLIRDWNEIWEEMSYEIVELLETGETMLISLRLRGRGSESGVEVDSTWGWVMRYRDGQLVAWEVYRDPDLARAAVATS